MMTKRRRCIKLSDAEEALLRTLHHATGVPDGQFAQRPEWFARFVAAWNLATGRSDTTSDVHHYIMTRRKRPASRPGRWEPLGPNHQRLACPGSDTFTSEQWAVVDELYLQHDVAADRLLVDETSRAELVTKFVARTGVHVPELLFMAALVARRKDGLLPKLEKDVGFNDFDAVEAA